jgi:hypothetical protein
MSILILAEKKTKNLEKKSQIMKEIFELLFETLGKVGKPKNSVRFVVWFEKFCNIYM